MTFIFKQAGEKLTGTQSGASGEPKVTGTVKGNKVVINVEGKNRGGAPYKNTCTGTIESPDKDVRNLRISQRAGRVDRDQEVMRYGDRQ
ncbi:MAG TPA: hypothetical protein VFD58_23815 [Blastocatellia bacterium]|nr:hypothetical protein [Blastocatellia bacterium]